MYGEISNAYVLRPASFTAGLIHSDPVIMAAHTCGRTRNSFTALHPPNCSRPWSDSSTLNLDRRHDPAEPSTSTPGLAMAPSSCPRPRPVLTPTGRSHLGPTLSTARIHHERGPRRFLFSALTSHSYSHLVLPSRPVLPTAQIIPSLPALPRSAYHAFTRLPFVPLRPSPCPRWTHIQMVQFKYLFYFISMVLI